MNTATTQRIIRELSPERLAKFPPLPAPALAVMSPQPSGPTTLVELSAALQNPLPKPVVTERCYNALEAFRNWKPLTLEMVRDLLAREAAAREQIIADYIERTGQQVALCEACELGVQEEEVEDRGGTIVLEHDCEDCEGLGVIEI